MFPKLVRPITQIKVAAIMSNNLNYFAVIAHNTEQHCGFVSVLSLEASHITLGGNYPQFGNH